MYLVKYSMFNLLKEWFRNYQEIQKEMRKMGIHNVQHTSGVFTYIDQEQYKRYLEDDRSNTISENIRKS